MNTILERNKPTKLNHIIGMDNIKEFLLKTTFDLPIVIQGGTGTGKYLVAKFILERRNYTVVTESENSSRITEYGPIDFNGNPLAMIYRWGHQTSLNFLRPRIPLIVTAHSKVKGLGKHHLLKVPEVPESEIRKRLDTIRKKEKIKNKGFITQDIRNSILSLESPTHQKDISFDVKDLIKLAYETPFYDHPKLYESCPFEMGLYLHENYPRLVGLNIDISDTIAIADLFDSEYYHPVASEVLSACVLKGKFTSLKTPYYFQFNLKKKIPFDPYKTFKNIILN